MTDSYLEEVLDLETLYCITLLEDMSNDSGDWLVILRSGLVNCYSILNRLCSESRKPALLRYWDQFKLNLSGYRSYILNHGFVEPDIMNGLELEFPRVSLVFGSLTLPSWVEGHDSDSDLDLSVRCNRLTITPGHGPGRGGHGPGRGGQG